MMLEMSPELTFGVLSPAFRGCEGFYALREYSHYGFNFLKSGLCELHGTALQPLECRFCHHERIGIGKACHTDPEWDWKSRRGQDLVKAWVKIQNERLENLETSE